MKKVWEFLKGFVLNIGANALIEELANLADAGLDEFYENDPVACKSLVRGLYAWIPYLQRIAAKTNTPLDDKTVAEMKNEIEQFAQQYGVDLPLLTTTKPNETGETETPA